MATSKSYFEYIKEQLSELSEVTFRPMMSEYVLYYDGKVVGGLYDDRLLVKETEGGKALLPDAPLSIPYPGSKAMLLVEETDDKNLLRDVLRATARFLPQKKKK